MGLFGNKKKSSDNVQPLSEREIQSRLYGHLREPSVSQEDLPSLSKPKSQEPTFFQKSISASGKTLTPSATPSAHKPTVVSSPELFDDTESEVESVPNRHIVDSAVKKHESTFNKPASFTAKPAPKVKPAGNSSAKIFSGIAQAAGRILRTIGVKILEVLGWIVTSSIRLISSIDFKKPAVRRLVMMVVTAGAFALIFLAIHNLNLRREAAMKNPPKAVVIPRHAKESKSKPAEIEPAALKTPLETKALTPAVEKKAAETAKKTAEAPAAAKQTSSAVNTETNSTVAETAQPAKPAAQKAPAATGNQIQGPAYVIQVATFAAQEDAKKLAERFNTESFNAFIKPLSRSGGRVYYCVFIGEFKTSQEAETTLAQFKKKDIAQPFQDAFIRLMQ